MQADLEAFGRSSFPEGEFRTKRLVFGPGGGDPIAVRFSGSDPKVLRSLGHEAIAPDGGRIGRSDISQDRLARTGTGYLARLRQRPGANRRNCARGHRVDAQIRHRRHPRRGVSGGRAADPDRGADAPCFRDPAGRSDGLFSHGRRLRADRAGNRRLCLRGAEHAGSPPGPLADPDGVGRYPARQDCCRNSRRDPRDGRGHAASPRATG